jgi:hypothetical protein
MDLREIKKEVAVLPELNNALKKFQNSWIKPIRSNTNSHLPSLAKLDKTQRQDFNQLLSETHKIITELKSSQLIHQKLNSYARHLIEMKLTMFNDDNNKHKMLVNKLVNDEFFNLKNTINDIKHFNKNVQSLTSQYHSVNELLHTHLSLEDSLTFMEESHLSHLNTLNLSAKKQKHLVKHLGEHFIKLAKND